MNVLQKLKQWGFDRHLHKVPFDKTGYCVNIIEEICEMWGYDKEQSRIQAKKLTELIVEGGKPVTEHGIVDAINDIMVFSSTALIQYKYDPELTLLETHAEINSRTGAYSEEERKWLKDTSPEAQAKWYKADYSGCKLKEID